jgi:hypothetical protein
VVVKLETSFQRMTIWYTAKIKILTLFIMTNNKKCLTLTEVDEILDDKDVVIDKLKGELELVNDNFVALKKQKSIALKAIGNKEFEKKTC